MSSINVLDLGCGDEEFYKNWICQQPRILRELHYPQGADQRNFRNASQAVCEFFPEIEGVSVVGIDKTGAPGDGEAIVDRVRVRINKMQLSFVDFCGNMTIQPANLAILAHPHSLNVLEESATNGIEEIIGSHLAPQGIFCVATDHTQRPRYRSVINGFVSRIQALGLKLDHTRKFDSSWSKYYLPERTHSLVFVKDLALTSSSQSVDL